MSEALKIIIQFILEYGDDAISLFCGLVKGLKKDAITSEEIRQRLAPQLDGTARAALERILNDPRLAEAHKAAEDALK